MFEGSRNVPNHEHFIRWRRWGGGQRVHLVGPHPLLRDAVAGASGAGAVLESDRMGYLLDALAQEKLDGQRAVVKNERRWRVDNRPYGIWDERLFELGVPGGASLPSSHHRLHGGPGRCHAGDVEDFFRAYYVPSNAVLTVAGRFNRAKALSLIRRYFDPIPAGMPPCP